ncbi:MAG TPA: biotin/lipoyl-containing protein [Terriglobales bacterium]|jgi:biotin carboxyl carrier protein|nr:biotin/lipoyl-containing protein [Terriglobales bacterium]
MLYDVTIDGKTYRLELSRAEGRWQCRLDGREVEIDAALTGHDTISVLMAGRSYEIKREVAASGTFLWIGSSSYSAEVRDPRSLRARKKKAGDESGPRKLVASMPGKVIRVLVSEKAEVEAGQGIVVMEAMKMQNEIKSPKKGIVQKLIAVEGATVNAGDVLAIVE